MNEPSPAAPDLDSMTKNELLTYAAEIGATGVNSAMRKADIIEAITGA